MNQPTNSRDPHSINSPTTNIGNSHPIDDEQNNKPLNSISQLEMATDTNSSLKEEIDFNELASFNPHAPLALEAQYQLAQDEENPLPIPVSERGIPRMVVMLLLTGGVILLGLVIWEFIKPKSVIKPIAQTTTKETQESLIEDEKPELLARLAYADQQKQVTESSSSQKQSPIKPEVKPTSSPVVERPTPRQTVARNPTLPPRTIVRTVTIPASTPNSVPVLAPSKPPVSPTPTIKDEKIDPFERWNQLAQLGQNRGNLKIDSKMEYQTASIPTGVDTSPSEAVPISEIQISSKSTAKEQDSNTPLTSTTKVPVAADPDSPSDIAEASVLSGSLVTASDRSSESLIATTSNLPHNRQSTPTELSPGAIGILTRTPQSPKPAEMTQVALGTLASGIVSVPLLWDEDGQQQLYNRFAITLTEDILAADGSVALKAGTVIIAKANHVGKGNRMVQASAYAIVYTDELGQVKQQNIPSGAILVTGENGEPLIAKGYFDPGGNIANQDILVALLSGAGRVGEILTQPSVRSHSSVNSGGFSSHTFTVENQNTQIWSTVLNGFFTPLAQRLEQRSNQADEELLNRPNIAIVPKGTKVSIVLNSFLSIN